MINEQRSMFIFKGRESIMIKLSEVIFLLSRQQKRKPNRTSSIHFVWKELLLRSFAHFNNFFHFFWQVLNGQVEFGIHAEMEIFAGQ